LKIENILAYNIYWTTQHHIWLVVGLLHKQVQGGLLNHLIKTDVIIIIIYLFILQTKPQIK